MSSDDDDAAAHHGGPISYWLQYKVTKIGRGWVILLVAMAVSWVVGKLS
jgi:hypothetical protein